MVSLTRKIVGYSNISVINLSPWTLDKCMEKGCTLCTYLAMGRTKSPLSPCPLALLQDYVPNLWLGCFPMDKYVTGMTQNFVFLSIFVWSML